MRLQQQGWLGIACLVIAACTTPSAPPHQAIDTLEKADNAFRAGNFALAQTHYESVIKDAPEIASAHFQLGRIAYRDTQLSQASVHFEAALAINPDHVPATYNLAIIHLQSARTLLAKHQTLAPVSAARPTLINVREAIEAIGKPSSAAE